MRTGRTLASRLQALLLVGVVGCGDDPAGPLELTLADLEGSWIATHFEFAPEGSGEAVEVIGFQATLSLTVASSGAFTAVFDPGPVLAVFAPDLTGGTFTGTVSLGSGTVTITPVFNPAVPLITANPMTFDYEWGGGRTLTLTGGQAVFDFAQDGEPEPARVTLVMQKT
jgi:hypothetical protein